ncbi:thioredoxin reductase [Kribbella amoyensis]|uniref:Thioredoxin reductase n=1 Tax=Kribbella amoyensis TaxID=996641 RepID=A0A561B0Q1_9ACTN|nr:NAD(P)/FAD-dependent oxidoreductase [Kribbella amoyensis]TWD72434.1 thioredoxin reductase [Kribbella amoyensis]
MYDVIVVGGGAAGLAGGLALARARRSVLVVDQGDPRNAPAGHVHNYLTRDGVPPAELYALGRAEITGYGGEAITGSVVSARSIDTSPDAPRFAVELADGRTYEARRLLVTTGVTDQLPEVEGLAERFGRDVLHCPYCHGWEVRDQAIGVMQSGPMGIHQAQLFRQWSEDVTLFLHNGPEPTDDEWEELAARGISVVQGEVEAVETDGDQLTGVRLRGGRVIPRQAVVVQTVLSARAGFLAELGLKAVEREARGVTIGTAVEAGPTGATQVPGVWVAGNVTEPMVQLITAAASGLAAGAAINADLIAEEVREAVAVRRG